MTCVRELDIKVGRKCLQSDHLLLTTTRLTIRPTCQLTPLSLIYLYCGILQWWLIQMFNGHQEAGQKRKWYEWGPQAKVPGKVLRNMGHQRSREWTWMISNH
jgi:hypothetical protein